MSVCVCILVVGPVVCACVCGCVGVCGCVCGCGCLSLSSFSPYTFPSFWLKSVIGLAGLAQPTNGKLRCAPCACYQVW